MAIKLSDFLAIPEAELRLRDRRSRTKERRYLLRRQIMKALGDKCCHCGFTDRRALQFDHIHGGGSKEYQAYMKNSSYEAYMRNVLANLHRFQLLCANCNWIKRSVNKEHS
jgi:hypothetical protein